MYKLNTIVWYHIYDIWVSLWEVMQLLVGGDGKRWLKLEKKRYGNIIGDGKLP